MRWLQRLPDYIVLIVLVLLIPASSPQLSIEQHIRIVAGDQNFDVVSWELNATWLKLQQSAISSPRYTKPEQQHQLSLDYLQLVDQVQKLQREIDLVYSDPAISDPETQTAEQSSQLAALTRQKNELAPFAEAIMEQQVTTILDELGFTIGGQPIPWVLYHSTPLPQYLVISPRDKIQQDMSHLLQPELTIEQAEHIEDSIAQSDNVSTLVVHIGGLAAYPTMVMRSTSQDWIADTVAHEWIHIYLYQHPLGQNYSSSPEVRTMNETAASIAGNEIGKLVMERYYPEMAQQIVSAPHLASLNYGPLGPWNFPPPFDFRAEMHETRVTTDALLAEGKIDEAEAYMDARRQLFWDHGYPIRKLNQAYFAFYGAYADQPGGAAGEDPVGPAVRALRAQSTSLLEFIQRIAEMESFEDLQAAVNTNGN